MTSVEPTSLTNAQPPPRSDASIRARHSRGGWATAVVMAVIVAVVLGGYVVAGALSQPAGPPVGFRGVVSVRPVSGWVYAGRGAIVGAP